MSARAAFPTDDMIVLALAMEGEEFRAAEDIASTLRRLGFVIGPQKMAGQLKRLCREDSPMIEARLDLEWRLNFYRVTRFGDCQLGNRFPKLWRFVGPPRVGSVEGGEG